MKYFCTASAKNTGCGVRKFELPGREDASGRSRFTVHRDQPDTVLGIPMPATAPPRTVRPLVTTAVSSAPIIQLGDAPHDEFLLKSLTDCLASPTPFCTFPEICFESPLICCSLLPTSLPACSWTLPATSFATPLT